MREEMKRGIKWISLALMIIICHQTAGTARAGTYKDPTVVLNVNCGDTYKYGDEVKVTVQIENADSFTKFGERSFTATKRSYIIKGGATGVTWHYTYDSGYEEPKGPEDFPFVETITREPIQIELTIDWYDPGFEGTIIPGDVTLEFYITKENVDPDVPNKIEWSGVGKGPVDVGPGESVTSTACLILSLPDYDGPGGECDSKTFNYDKELEAWEDEQQDLYDQDQDCQQEGSGSAGMPCPGYPSVYDI
ncbi:MAG: hypothetical protein V1789_00505 [PVC group bacterium]